MGLLADHEELALESVGVGCVLAATDEELTDHRLDRGDAFAEARRVHGDVAPSEHGLSFSDHQFPKQVFAHDTVDGVLGEEQHADAIFAGGGQVDALFGHLGSEQPIGDLEQHAGSVTCERVGANSAAMGEVGERGQALIDDLPALAPLDVGDEADATRVMVEPGVTEPLVVMLLCLVRHDSSHPARRPTTSREHRVGADDPRRRIRP